MRFVIADPNVAWLVLLGGILLVYFEANHPGLVLPGVVGAVLAMLAVASLGQFGIDWRGVVFSLTAAALLFSEARLGWYGIAAGACLTTAGILLGVRPLIAASASLPFAALTVYLLKVALRAAQNKSSV